MRLASHFESSSLVEIQIFGIYALFTKSGAKLLAAGLINDVDSPPQCVSTQHTVVLQQGQQHHAKGTILDEVACSAAKQMTIDSWALNASQ